MRACDLCASLPAAPRAIACLVCAVSRAMVCAGTGLCERVHVTFVARDHRYWGATDRNAQALPTPHKGAPLRTSLTYALSLLPTLLRLALLLPLPLPQLLPLLARGPKHLPQLLRHARCVVRNGVLRGSSRSVV